MAEEIVFKTRVDTGNTANDLDKVDKSLKDIDNSTKASSKGMNDLGSSIVSAGAKVDKMIQQFGENSKQADTARKKYAELQMEQTRMGKTSQTLENKLKALNEKVNSGTLDARQMSRAIKEYQTIALQSGRTSPVGKQAIQDAAALTDRVKDLQNEINRAAHDGANMQAALQLGGTVIAGYGAVKAATAMLGIENESLQQTFVKLQAAQMALASVEQIRSVLEKESFLMMKAKSIQIGILTGATALYSTVVGAATGATKLFRLALMSTGILAIVVGVGLLIANFETLVGWLKSAISWLSSWSSSETDAAKASQEASDKIRRGKQAIKAEHMAMVDGQIRDNLKLRRDITTTYDWEIRKAKAAGKNTSELEAKKREELLKTYEVALELAEEQLKFSSSNANQMLRSMQTIADARAKIHSITQEQEIVEIETATNNAAEKEKLAQTAADNAEKRRLKNIELQAQEDALSMERQKIMQDFIAANIEDEALRKATQMAISHEREKEALIKKYGEDTELIKQLEQKQNQEITAFEDSLDAQQIELQNQKIQERLELENVMRRAALEDELLAMREDFEIRMALEVELAELEREIALQNKELTEADKFEIERAYNEKLKDLSTERGEHEKKIQEDIASSIQQFQGMAFSAIGDMSDLYFSEKTKNLEKGSKEELVYAKKQFETNKKMQIATAIISGVQGVVNALTAQSVVPEPFGTILKAASAVAVGVASAANISKIKNSKFEGGGGGGGGAPSVPAPPSMASLMGEGGSTEFGETASDIPIAGGGNGTPSIKVNLVDSEVKASLDNSEKVNIVSSYG